VQLSFTEYDVQYWREQEEVQDEVSQRLIAHALMEVDGYDVMLQMT